MVFKMQDGLWQGQSELVELNTNLYVAGGMLAEWSL